MNFHWEHLLRIETPQKSLLKTFFYNNKGTKKVRLPKTFFNKEIYFILQSNSSKYTNS